MARTPMPLDTIIDVLSTSSDRLVTLSDALTSEQLLTEPEPGEWCARDGLAHILACQQTWGGCAVRLLREDEPELRGTDPMTLLAASDYGERSFASLQTAFTEQRTQFMAVLATVTEANWARTGTLVGAGAPFTVTPRYYADKLARHEQPHLKQMTKAAAAVRARSRALWRPGSVRRIRLRRRSSVRGVPLVLRSVSLAAHDPAAVAKLWATLLGRRLVQTPDGPLLTGDETQVGLRLVDGPANARPGFISTVTTADRCWSASVLVSGLDLRVSTA